MNFTLSASSNLPTGATVKVFARSLFPSVPLVPQGAPPGSGEVFTGTMGASSLTVTGLAADTAYTAYSTPDAGTTHKYVQFRSAASVTGTLPTRTVTLTAQAYTTVAADHDHSLAVTTGATTATITLEAAATAGDGATLIIRKVDSGAGRVAVNDVSTEIISLSTQYDTAEFRSNGTSWEIINRTLARWRVVRDIGSAANLPAAAATGKYIRNTAVASINTNIDSAVISGSVMAEHGTKFRLRIAAFSTGGAGSDPTTTTVRCSLYDVTYAAGTTGATFTLGTEIAASVISGLSPTPRGTLVRGESTSFTIDTSKDYAVVAEVVTAALPASTSVSGTAALIAID